MGAFTVVISQFGITSDPIEVESNQLLHCVFGGSELTNRRGTARNFRSEKQFGHFFIAKRIATATVSLPAKRNRLLESGQACGHHLW